MVKSVNVLQKYFLCLGVIKPKNIGIFVRAWPWFNYFVHPHLKRKGTSKLFPTFHHENVTASRGWKAMMTMEGKLQQVKSLLSSSSINDFRVIHFELTSKIRSSIVLTSKDLYQQFLAKKLHRNFLSESFFPSKMTESGEQKWIALRYG